MIDMNENDARKESVEKSEPDAIDTHRSSHTVTTTDTEEDSDDSESSDGSQDERALKESPQSGTTTGKKDNELLRDDKHIPHVDSIDVANGRQEPNCNHIATHFPSALSQEYTSVQLTVCESITVCCRPLPVDESLSAGGFTDRHSLSPFSLDEQRETLANSSAKVAPADRAAQSRISPDIHREKSPYSFDIRYIDSQSTMVQCRC